MKPLQFYDLKLDKAEIWSPNTCKTRFALNLKGLAYETTWFDFMEVKKRVLEIPDFDPTKPLTVPVLHDPNTGITVQDSWDIAEYLDKQYPDTRRSLLHGDKNADLNQIFTMLFSTLDSIGQA